MIEVTLSTALLCFAGACHPVIVGTQTPIGEFTIAQQFTKQRGYQGDVLLFHETSRAWYAIHRTWPGRERLYANASIYRRVSLGCINVQPEVYDKLVALSGAKLIIKP